MIENREVKIAKELDDVLILVRELIRTIKNKGGIEEYTGLMDELINAISGADKLPEEFNGDMEAFIATIALRINEIAFMFVKKEEK